MPQVTAFTPRPRALARRARARRRYFAEWRSLASDYLHTFGEGGACLLPAVHRFAWGDWRPAGEKMVSPGGRTLTRAKWDELSRVRTEAVRPGKSRDPRPGTVKHVHPDHVHVDPQRFQFKLKTDPKTGAVGELAQVATYDPELAGVLAVWHDPALGRTFVVNGHNRLELAKRSGAPRVLVRYVKARDAAEARAKGALVNIAEGRGTAVDAAKFLRDTNTTVADLARAGVSLSGPVARDAVTLAKLAPDLFHKVTLGVLDVPRALAVAQHLAGHDDQRLLLSHVDRRDAKTGREVGPAAVAEAAREMAATPRAEVSGPGGGLFGNDPELESVFLQRAELKAHVRASLARHARDFALLASKRRAEAVAPAGNVIDTARNRLEGERATDLAADFDRQANRPGPVSDALNRLAARLANAHTDATRDRVRKEAVDEVRKAVAGPGLVRMSEWVAELSPFWTFAWQEGKRGGRYWLPDGKPDAPANRLYGTKAQKAADASEGKGQQKAQRPAAEPRGPRPGEAERVARAKWQVAADAHAAAAHPESGVPAEQVAWLKKRMDAAAADLGKHAARVAGAAPPASPAAPPKAPPAPAAGGKVELTPEDHRELERRRSIAGRVRAWLEEKYAHLEDEFGPTGAKAVLAATAAAAPVPVPGSVLVPYAVAKGVQAVGRALGLAGESKEKPKAADRLPDHATAAGFRSWRQVERRGMRRVVEEAPAMARAALAGAATRMRGSFAGRQNYVATEIVRRANAGGGDVDGALRSIANEFLERGRRGGGEPGQQEEGRAIGEAIEEYRFGLHATRKAAPPPESVAEKPWELLRPRPGESRAEYVRRSDARVPRAAAVRKPTPAEVGGLKHDMKYVEKLIFPAGSGLRLAVRRGRGGTVRVVKVGPTAADSVFSPAEHNAVRHALRAGGFVGAARGEHFPPVDYPSTHGGALAVDAAGRHPDYANQPDLRGRVEAGGPGDRQIEATTGGLAPTDTRHVPPATREMRPSGKGEAWEFVPPSAPPGGTPAEQRALEALARAEVGTPAYERAKTMYVKARAAAKGAGG